MGEMLIVCGAVLLLCAPLIVMWMMGDAKYKRGGR